MMNELQLPGHSGMDKKPIYNYYVRLESESSMASEEDAESIDSIQGKETEYVQDSEDTDCPSEADTDTYFEYEVASLSETEDIEKSGNSTSGTDDIYETEEAIAAVLGDTSLEAWAPDNEEETSTSENEDFEKTDFWTCAQCKSKNNNPQFRLCEKCFQVRKTSYPPRPKRSKKRKTQSNTNAVNVDNLKSCLSGLSQDSGLGSSQEFPVLDFQEIKIPEQHLGKSNSSSCSAVTTESTSSGSSSRTNDSGFVSSVSSRKRKYSENSDTDVRPKKIIIQETLSTKNESVGNNNKDDNEIKTELREQCMMCFTNKKDGIFLHGSSAHSCCCYKCALKTWKTLKRCPVCNRRVSNVVKLYTL